MVNQYLRRLNFQPKPEQEDCSLAAISLFSGGGGLDLGLSFAGFSILFASDIESSHCDTIKANFPSCVTETCDIKNLTGQHVREVTGKREFDVLAGGPPCQAFSILGQRNSFDDPRGSLVFEYIRLINELSPRAFVFENVPGLLTLNAGSDWRILLNKFAEKTGYVIYDDVLNAADFGIPQIRRRIFVVGFRNKKVDFEFPEPTHSPRKSNQNSEKKMSHWIPAHLALISVEGLPNHRIRPHTKAVRLRYRKIQPGERDRVDHTDRVHPDRPTGTVLVGSKGGGGRPFIHPFEDRHLTVREAARLQSFPDWYVFHGTNTWQYRAVGNAVPPLLARAVGLQIRKALESIKEKKCRRLSHTQAIAGR